MCGYSNVKQGGVDWISFCLGSFCWFSGMAILFKTTPNTENPTHSVVCVQVVCTVERIPTYMLLFNCYAGLSTSLKTDSCCRHLDSRSRLDCESPGHNTDSQWCLAPHMRDWMRMRPMMLLVLWKVPCIVDTLPISHHASQ